MGVSQWSDGWVQGKSMGKWRLGLPPLMETPVSLQYGVEDTHAEAAEAILTSWSLRYHLLNRTPPRFAPILLSSLGFWNGIWKNQTSLGWIQSCAGQFPFWRVHKFLIVNIIVPSAMLMLKTQNNRFKIFPHSLHPMGILVIEPPEIISFGIIILLLGLSPKKNRSRN